MFERMKFKAVSRTLVTLGVITMLSACGGKNAQQQAMMGAGGPVEVDTYTVTMGSMNMDDAYPATIKGKSDVEVRPMVSGNITRVCVEEGQRVSKGQVLFLIDDVNLRAAVTSAEAGVASAQSAVANAQAGVASAKSAIATAESQVATARLTANNQKKLLDKGIISSYQYETATLNLRAAESQANQARAGLSSAQAGVNSARSGLAQAQAAVTQARKNLSYARVTAPCAGVVGKIPNREGSLASPSGAALTTISENGDVYAYFSLNEKQVISLTKNGQITLESAISSLPQVKLRLSDGNIYGQAGRVSTVAGVLDVTTGTAQVKALFPNTNGMLQSGATGEVLIPAQSQNVIMIPQKATYEVQDQKYVYVIGKDRKATSRAIKVMAQNDGVNYAVTEGLNVGEVIAVEGIGTQVKDGVTVNPKGTAAKEAAKQGTQK